MIDLAGWTSKILADGLAFFPPGGKEVGAVRMRERVRPLRSLKDIVAPDLARMSERLAEVQIATAQRFLTAAGEYAAMLVITGHLREQPEHRVERCIAIVFGDDFYQRFDSIMQEPARFEVMRSAIRQLAVESSLGLGELRWRRFTYTPPPGWQPLIRNLTTEWFPLDFPRCYRRLAVPPAYASQDPSVLGKAVMRYTAPGFVPTAQDGPHPVETRALGGYINRMRGPTSDGKQLVYEQVLMYDTRFSYIACLECEADDYNECHEMLRALVESFEPHQIASQNAANAMVHWVT